MRQRLSASSWMQRTPAGLPPGIPGIGEEMEGAIQHAPQPAPQSMSWRGRAPALGRCVAGIAVPTGAPAGIAAGGGMIGASGVKAAGVGIGNRYQGRVAPGAGEDLGGAGGVGSTHFETVVGDRLRRQQVDRRQPLFEHAAEQALGLEEAAREVGLPGGVEAGDGAQGGVVVLPALPTVPALPRRGGARAQEAILEPRCAADLLEAPEAGGVAAPGGGAPAGGSAGTPAGCKAATPEGDGAGASAGGELGTLGAPTAAASWPTR